MLTVNDRRNDVSSSSPPASHPRRRYTLLTLVIVAQVAFIVGGAVFGTIAKFAWEAHANGWKEIALGYKAVSASCVSVGPNTIQPMQESDEINGEPSSIVAKP